MVNIKPSWASTTCDSLEFGNYTLRKKEKDVYFTSKYRVYLIPHFETWCQRVILGDYANWRHKFPGSQLKCGSSIACRVLFNIHQNSKPIIWWVHNFFEIIWKYKVSTSHSHLANASAVIVSLAGWSQLWLLFVIYIFSYTSTFVFINIFIGPESDHWQCLSLTD